MSYFATVAPKTLLAQFAGGFFLVIVTAMALMSTSPRAGFVVMPVLLAACFVIFGRWFWVGARLAATEAKSHGLNKAFQACFALVALDVTLVIGMTMAPGAVTPEVFTGMMFVHGLAMIASLSMAVLWAVLFSKARHDGTAQPGEVILVLLGLSWWFPGIYWLQRDIQRWGLRQPNETPSYLAGRVG